MFGARKFGILSVLAMIAVSLTLSLAAAETDFTESQIRAFVRVQNQLGQLQQEFQQKMEQAGSEQEMEKINFQANQEMLMLIQSQGLTPEIFGQIVNQAQVDPGLMERIQNIAMEKSLR